MGKMKATTIDQPDAAPAVDIAPAAVEPALVVFGRDDAGKPHASKFGAADAELAIKAAGLMGYRVLPITSDEHRAAVAGVAPGRVFASGRAFTPFCKEATHEALERLPGAYAPPPPVEPAPEPPPVATTAPATWADIGVGALVLAAETPDEPWYPSVVVEAKGEGLFVLRWRDFADEPSFVRRGEDLALLSPNFLTIEAGGEAPSAEGIEPAQAG